MITRLLLMILLCAIFINEQKGYTQVAEWAPQINTSKIGGTNADGVFNNLIENSWFDSNNWNFTSGTIPTGGIPDQNTMVIIKSGTAPCYIPIQDLGSNLPRAKSITIENNAGLFNVAGQGLNLPARFLEVDGDFTINTGGTYIGNTEEIRINKNFLNNGDFIIRQGENVIQVGGNYTNNSRVSKETTFINRRVIIDFRKDIDAVFTNNTLYDNTYTPYSNYNTTPGSNSFTDQSLFVTNAFDGMLLNKENQATVTNATSTPIYVGVVTSRGDLEVSGTGNLSIISGSLLVKNVINTTNNITVSDGSPTHPRGYSWDVPEADINIRGNLIIADAGPLGNSNGASLDLFDIPTTASTLALYLGGNLIDNNSEIASNASNDRRGLYVGPSTITTNNNTNDGQRPFLIFNGINDGTIALQVIRGQAPLLNDAADERTEGMGIFLPRVIILDNDLINATSTTDNQIELGSGVRIVGDLTIHKNTVFNLLSNTLLIGDNPNDELNVFGTLRAESNAEFRMHEDVIIRGRKGGNIVISGSNSGPVFFSRGHVGRYRFAVYSGCYISVIYGDFFAMSTNNADYALSNTGTATDNTTGGLNSNGGLKIYEGATLDPINNFSFSRLPNVLTLNMDIPITSDSPDDGTGDGFGTITIDNFFFGGFTSNSIARNNRNGTVQLINATGNSAAGGVGENFDLGRYSNPSGTNSPDRIIWINNIKCVWQGGVSTSWNNVSNWVNAAGSPLGFIPGTTGNSAVDVIIPRGAIRDCQVDVNNLNIQGTLRVNTSLNGSLGINRSLQFNSSITLFRVGLDIVIDDNGTISVHNNPFPIQCRIEIGGTINFSNSGVIFNAGTSIIACVGDQRQRVTVGVGVELYTLEVADSKTGDVFIAGGGVTFQGDLIVRQGLFRGNGSNADIRIKGNFIQTGGDIFPWNSNLFVEGNWLNTGGTMANSGNGTFNFEPGNSTSKQILTNGQVFTIVNFNDTGLGNITEYNLSGDFNVIVKTTINQNCQLNIPNGNTANFGQVEVNNGGILNVQAGGTLAIEANEKLTVRDGGRIQILGTISNYARISRQGSTGRYAFEIEGTIVARYYLIESLDVNGVHLMNTAKSESPGTITYGGGGSGYITIPDVNISGGGGSGATFNAILTGNEITGFTKINGGENYTQNPVITLLGGGGAGATGQAILTPTSLDKIAIFDGGLGYTDGSYLISISGGTSDAMVDVIVTGGAIVTINVINAGAGYTSSPLIDLSSLGNPTRAASLGIFLNPTSIDQIVVPPASIFPVASFSDGIFIDGIDGGAFITIEGDYTTYRAANNRYSINTSLLAPQAHNSPLPTGVTHDYDADPRIDTIHNIVFPRMPLDVDAAVAPYNIKRNSTSNNPYVRMVIKNALGTFSGEDFDLEENVTPIGAGSPDNIINPYGITVNDSMIVWRSSNIKRWDGGPTSSGTSWSDPQNWRPDGVPGPGDKIIINYDLLQTQLNVVTGPPQVVAPTNFIINFDLDPSLQPITCRSLTIESMLPDPNPGNQRQMITLNILNNITIQQDFIASEETTINPNTGTRMRVGGNWNNDGIFNPGSSTMMIDFDQNFTRTVTNGTGTRFSSVTFSKGTTDLGADLYVEGNLIIEDDAFLGVSNNNRKITLEGDWLNKGIFNPRQGTVQFGSDVGGGKFIQDVTKEPITDLQTFYNVIINKAVGHVETGSRMQIDRELNIATGRIVTTTDKEVIFGDVSTIPLVTTNTFIDGPCAHLFSNTTLGLEKFYPIGKNGVYIGGATANPRINLNVQTTSGSLPAGSFLMMVMEQFETPAASRVIPNGTGVNYVSRSRHWKVTQKPYPNTNSSFVQSGGVDVTMDRARISLAYDASSERGDFSGNFPFLFGTNLEEVAFGALGQLTILKDSGGDLKGEGIGYPIITVSDGVPGTGAIAEPIINNITGEITGYNIINGGTGYDIANPPLITVGGGGSGNNSIPPGTGANAVAAVNASGAIIALNVVNSGNGYNASFPPNVTIGGTGAIGRALVTSGMITGIEIIAPGTGYKSPTVSIADGSPTTVAAATATTNIDGQITSFIVTDAGSGYNTGSNEWIDALGNVTNINDNQFTVRSTGPDNATLTFNTLGNGDFTLAWNFIALPVQPLDLDGKVINNREVLLSWKTIDDHNAMGFDIQASRDDGKTFQTIGHNKVQNTGSGIQNYMIRDQQPIKGINYYRIKQANINGTERFSKVISVTLTNQIPSFKIAPNIIESGEFVNIFLSSKNLNNVVEVQLLDLIGNIVKKQEFYATDQITFKIPAIASGLYFVALRMNGKVYRNKIVVR
ncbi:MAG TPA: hypothetical protein DCS93_19405 [Microscillaceae bacterium]|nr:hypothetical protein [Microscillaceae bacterium]